MPKRRCPRRGKSFYVIEALNVASDTTIGLLTPSSLHYGLAPEIIEARSQTLEKAWLLHPERFVKGIPVPAKVPAEPASVSPDKSMLPPTKPLNTRAMPIKIPSATEQNFNEEMSEN